VEFADFFTYADTTKSSLALKVRIFHSEFDVRQSCDRANPNSNNFLICGSFSSGTPVRVASGNDELDSLMVKIS
jgi:hypothetical protein